MRIAFFSYEASHAALLGGVGIHVSCLAHALCRAGHELHVFCRPARGQRLYDRIFGVHYHRCPHDPCADGVEEVTVALASSFLHYFRRAQERHGAFDLVHAHDWFGIPPALRIAADQGTPMALTFHSTEWGRSGNWPDRGDSRRIAEVERAGAGAAAPVIAVSLEVRRRAEALYQVPDWKTALVYHGIDLAPFDRARADPGEVKAGLGLAPLAPTLLFPGRLDFRRGPDLLLRAMPEILAARPDARLVFAGDGGMRGHLENEATRLDVAHAVRFPGEQTPRRLVELLQACDLVCTPSRVDPFGRYTLMAWAAGKPVLTSAGGATGEFVFNAANGLVVEPEAKAIATGVTEALSDFDRLRWMGRNGRVTVETAFTWERAAGRTLAAYDRRRMAEA